MTRTIVGEAFIQILPTDGGVTPGVQKIIDNLPKQVNVPVTADTEQATTAVAGLAAQIENGIGGAWLAAGAQAAAFTASVFGVKAAIEGAVNSLAGLFDNLRQAQAGFSAILGSESAGTRLLDEIREFARVSPFVTEELVNYSQQLLGVGQSAESIVPLLERTGDLIASVGGDTQNISRVLFTLTQIRSIGRLVGQDAIQLQSALIPITKLLAEFLGKTTAEIKKMQEQGAISADTVFAAISAAGEKVEGAMANATRNISGARSVLDDTVKGLKQNSELLNTVNDDIVKGILDFTTAISENERFTQTIASLDASLLSLYESLKPLFEAFSGTSANLALTGLEVLASSLEILSSALEAIPVPVLDALGKALAVIFALKAPTLLFTYVQSITRLAEVFRPDFIGRVAGTTAAIEAQGAAADVAATKVERLSVAQQRAVTTAAALAFAIGTVVDSLAEGNQAAETLATSLQTGALGAQLGAQIGGLQGAAIGGGLGIGVGLVTSLVTGARKEAEARKSELEEIGQEIADSIRAKFELTNPDITNVGDITAFIQEGADYQDTIDQLDVLKKSYQDLSDTIRPLEEQITADPNNQGLRDQYANLAVELGNLQDQIEALTPDAEEAQAVLDDLFNNGDYKAVVDDLQTKFTQLGDNVEGYEDTILHFLRTNDDLIGGMDKARLLNVLQGEATTNLTSDWEVLDRFLRDEFGITLERTITDGFDNLLVVFNDDLPTALELVKTELASTVTAFNEAKTAAEGFFKVFADQNAILQSSTKGYSDLAAAQQKILEDTSTTNLLAYSDALRKVAENATAAAKAADPTLTDAQALEQGYSVVTASLERLQEQLDLTDGQFRALLDTAGLSEFALLSQGVEGFAGTLNSLADEVDVPIDRLKELLGLSADLSNFQQVTISVDVLEGLNAIGFLEENINNLPGDVAVAVQQIKAEFLELAGLGNLVGLGSVLPGLGGGAGSGEGGAVTGIPGDITDFRRLQSEAVAWQAEVERARQADAARAAEEARKLQEEAEREAERQRREAERLLREQEAAQREAERLLEEQRREQERLREALKNASQTIESSMLKASQDIAAAADALTTGLRDRVQDDQAVSVRRLILNAQDQANRVSELGQGIESLRARGLSNDAIQELGIDNVADIRQLRRLLGASASDLQELNRLITLRDDNAEAIARRERQQETQATIVAAILQAAAILGYDLTPQAAAALALQVNITGDPASAVLPAGIIEQIQNSGVLLRR